MGGLSRRYVKVQELRDEGKNPLMLDAGDLFFSTPNIKDDNRKAEAFRAGAILEGLNQIGFDAINIGKYELLNGLSFLKNMTTKINTPFLSANLRNKETNELLFKPYLILEKTDVTFGIIGVTSQAPDTSNIYFIDNYIEAGMKYIDELKNQVDIIIVLANTDRASQSGLVDHFKEADFIITSGATNMTRANSSQEEDGPFLYSCGKQGKYFMVVDVEMTDKNQSFVDVSKYKKKIKDITNRFKRLQKKDPERPIEQIYSDQQNVLNLIKQYRIDVENAENAIANAANTIKFQSIGLNKKIKDNSEMLTFVNNSLATCKALAPQKKQSTSKKNKRSKIDHSGHDH